MSKVIHINFNDLIFKLLCWYAFFIPLEKILEVLFEIETIFKPYRTIALIIIFIFGIKSVHKWNENLELKRDIFLYLIFAYGLLISAYRMITVRFSTFLFYNDVFQMGLYLAVFVVIRHTEWSRERLLIISKYLAIGVLVNCIFVFNSFFILQNFRREAGFMDNPNYFAFSIVIFMLLALSLRPTIKTFFKKSLWWMLMIFMGAILLVTGSRTGIVVLLLSSSVLLFLSPLRQRRGIVILAISIAVIISVRAVYFSNHGGPLIGLKRITDKKTSDDPRIPMWLGIIKASQETNFVGLGMGQFKARFHEFFYDENNSLIKKMISRGYFLSPHSDYFALLIIYGIFGLTAYLVFLFLNGIELMNRFNQAENSQIKSFFRYSISAFVAIVIFGIAAENFTSALYWLVLSISTKTQFLES